MAKRDVIIPTDEEDAAINAGIALDPDNPEWTDEDFARARPAIEVCPEIVAAQLAGTLRVVRGKQRAPVKEKISIRLSTDVVERLRGMGPGWQSRADEMLRTALDRGH